MVKEKYMPYVESEKESDSQKTPKELKKEKRENFWYYNKTKIFVAIFGVFAVLLLVHLMLTPVEPDYTVGLMSEQEWTEEQIQELEVMLRPYGRDLNGDSVVRVSVVLYQPDEADEQTNDVILCIADEANVLEKGIGEGVFCKTDDSLSLVEDGEEVTLEDVTINWMSCDGISKDPYFDSFTDTFYFAMRGKEGDLESDTYLYNFVAEMFFRIEQNEPYDTDLLDTLLEAKAASSSAE